jgi:hypothetical protein
MIDVFLDNHSSPLGEVELNMLLKMKNRDIPFKP